MKPKRHTKQITLGPGVKVDFPVYEVPPLPKFYIPRELQGKLVVPVDIRRYWAKHHMAGCKLTQCHLSTRARDWYWRAAMLRPKATLPERIRDPANDWRKQLVREFSKALECGKLKSFVMSLAKALQKPAERYNVQSAITAFLINGWLYPEAPLCCFTDAALADLLAIVFKDESIDFKAVARRCQRLRLRQVPNPLVSVVFESNGRIVLKAV